MVLFAIWIAMPIGLAVGLWGHLMAAEDERRTADLAWSVGLGALGAVAGAWVGHALLAESDIAIWAELLLAFVGSVVLVSAYHAPKSRRSRLR